MEGPAAAGELESYVIWGLIAAVWLAMTWFVLKQLRAARGGLRLALFFPGVLMVAVAAAPVWFMVLLMLFSMGTYGPEGPVGVGSAAMVAGGVLAVITGLALSSVIVLRDRPGRVPS